MPRTALSIISLSLSTVSALRFEPLARAPRALALRPALSAKCSKIAMAEDPEIDKWARDEAAKTVVEAMYTKAVEPNPVDFKQLAVYPLATTVQFALIAGIFKAIDYVIGTLPSALVPPIFLFLSLRSRVFSCLSAKRPPRGGYDDEGSRVATPKEVKRPSWTPPGIAFPFIWITISFLRASSSLLVWRATGKVLAAPALLVLVLHLCVGDTWNCVTNVERRLGTSAVGVLAVLASVYAAVGTYYRAAPLAGKLLAPSAVWISIASVLTWTIWSINEPREPLLPKQDGSSAPLQVPLIAADCR